MPYAYLLVSLLTPWLAGFFMLRAVEARASHHPHPLRQIAFGFFVGYSLLQLLVLSANAVLGSVPVVVINATLIIIAVCAHLVYRRLPAAARKSGQTSAQANDPTLSHRKSWVFWFFLCLAIVHLSLAAIELVHRPIFPWDAWLSWMYRAKAWFFAGSIVPMDAPHEWIKGTGNAAYNVAGAHYPTLLPITALWTALHLGQWSETLVNLPVIACGVALAGGMYGLCREAGRSPGVSIIAAYLVLSIPLMSTHLSLAGQADTWMAGYAGLGVSACLLGLVRKSTGLFCLGLLLTALSMGAKAEGGVWLFVALSVGAVTWISAYRKWLYVLPLPALALVLWLTGVHFIELPLLGGVGVSDGALHASFLGSHRLERHDVLGDYWQNFFLEGSWHLLWPLLILAAVAMLRRETPRERLVVLTFLAAVIASQAFIFGFTVQGVWAEDWTAINRIPLHLAPALVFCLALVSPAQRQRRSETSGPVPLIAGTAALLAAGAITLVYLGTGFPGESGTRTDIRAANHRLMMGGGELRSGQRHITRFDNNVALVSSGPVTIDADAVSLASITTSGSNRNGQNFFWRTASDPENLKMSQYEGRGTTYLRLGDHPDWKGNITEIGLVFYDDGGSLAVGNISVQPDAFSTRLRQVGTEWTQMLPWSQKSLNWLPAGTPKSLVSLPLFLAGWLLISLALLAYASRKQNRHNGLQGAIALSLVAWLVLDLRWLINQGANTLNTVSEYPPGNSQPLRFGGDTTVRQVVEEATRRLPADSMPLLITADDARMSYQRLRAKYHALPQAAYVHGGGRDTLPTTDKTGYLLVLKQPFRDPNAPASSASEWQTFLANRNHNYRVLWESPDGFLLGRTAEAGQRTQADPRR